MPVQLWRNFGCDDLQINKLNRAEVSVDDNSHYLLSPSDPEDSSSACQVEKLCVMHVCLA